MRVRTVTNQHRARLGYQPGLDGIRTFSVGLVVIHHAEIVQMEVVGGHHETLIGGFVYPEMFFVMSGFLITTLMLQERQGTGTFGVGAFYGRRARRLLPGLWAMMLAVTVWAVFFGNVRIGGVDVGNAGLSGLKASTIPTLLMSTNWWMIASGNGYFGSFPNLLRHIWSLSIDEQFYIVWPVVLWLALRNRRFDPRRLARICVPVALIGWIVMAVVYRSPANGDSSGLNFAYLSTITRVPGIMVGCALACVWRPWTWKRITDRHLPILDLVAMGAFGLIVTISLTVHNESAIPYRGGFILVALLAAIVAGAVIHPGAHLTRAFFGNRVISGVGKRAFGIYLWHWPIMAGPLAESTFATKMYVGLPATAVLAEFSYRYIEGPFRDKRIDGWLRSLRARRASIFAPDTRPIAIAAASVLFLAGSGVAALATAATVDITEDKREIDVDLGKVTGDVVAAPSGVAEEADRSGPSATGPSATEPSATDSDDDDADDVDGPMRLAVVGGSQAEVFVKNKPSNIGKVFQITGDGKAGCSVFDRGSLITSYREKFGWNFKVCEGWQDEWATQARRAKADVTMVMTGGWDVFSLRMPDGSVLTFGSKQWDELWLEQMLSGVRSVLDTGSRVALLEAPCQRPIETPAAGVPPLPERRDDQRMAHVSALMREIAADDPEHVFYLDGPDEWCDDPSISENPEYRYDGIHVLKPGAKLILEKVGPQLLDIPRRDE